MIYYIPFPVQRQPGVPDGGGAAKRRDWPRRFPRAGGCWFFSAPDGGDRGGGEM